MSTGAASGFKLPNSTLSYHFDSSCLYWCRKILPADALKELEPFMKKPARYAKQINYFFDWFRDDLIRMEQEGERKSQENSDAQTVLSDYWRNHWFKNGYFNDKLEMKLLWHSRRNSISNALLIQYCSISMTWSTSSGVTWTRFGRCTEVVKKMLKRSKKLECFLLLLCLHLHHLWILAFSFVNWASGEKESKLSEISVS